jgi:nicotinate-nucleotide pyrophosphorylase (carboxylating)
MSTYLPPAVDALIELALNEDLGNGDTTTRLTVPRGKNTNGVVLAREPLIISGGDIFARVMHKIDPNTKVELCKAEGTEVAPQEILIKTQGKAASLLMGERVALNFLQRLSGVATLTYQYIQRLPNGSQTIITDTRKTTPGMRHLERRAVIHGGGRNHRADLGGGLLIKENHIAAAGSVTEAIRLCLKGAPHPLKVEVEVQNEEELKEAIKAGAHVILLDNMTPKELQRCVAIGKNRVFMEASGGITLETVNAVAQTGVDAISVGALTHSHPSVDITFLIEGT